MKREYRRINKADKELQRRWARGDIEGAEFIARWIEREQERITALRFLCIDCSKDTCGGEYYMVHDAVWAASGLAPNDGMLCLACLGRRIKRPLTLSDFTAVVPSREAWRRYEREHK